eukprot:GILJ01002353.1.p1 GENE.GILJ01002353.1~~GILJ01002353.1.p1  ORF type:complete len:476 (+),score=54.94 GILJ01002353.1:113-1429(+)
MVCLAAATPVYVMLPLDTVNEQNQLKDPNQLRQWLSTLKGIGVTGVSMDMWWGLVEPQPRQYAFGAYIQLTEMIRDVGLKVLFIMSFHQCGGNVGDNIYIPLPSWVTSVPDIFYKDRDGFENKEYISLFADNLNVLQGRTPVQTYRDMMSAFLAAFQSFMVNTISGVEVGLGPAGELRYPSYPLSKWQFCGIGAFQCYDKYALQDLANAAQAAGRYDWSHGGPANAGNYNSNPYETGFFSGGNDNFQSAYGVFFLSWYSQALLAHGDRVLAAASEVFKAFRNVKLAAKVAGIHWWYLADHHASELTAGYYNTRERNGYLPFAQMFSKYGVTFDFTCMEMKNSEQPSQCASGPENLVAQTKAAATQFGIGYAGENALPRFDYDAYQQIQQQAFSQGHDLENFTYLRLGPDLMSDNNLYNFANFVKSMSSQAPQHFLSHF